MGTAHEVGLLLATIPALLDAAVRLADHVERLTLPEGHSPAVALQTADASTTELHRALCAEAARGGRAYAAPIDALAAMIEAFHPFRIEDCGAIKAELARVRELVAMARHSSRE
jgi:hypothetical protein